MPELKKVLGKSEYTVRLGDAVNDKAEAIITAGGQTVSKFVPNINASKWDDECWLNLNYADIVVIDQKEGFTNGLIEFIAGSVTWRNYTYGPGVLELEIEFATTPIKNTIELTIQDSGNLDYHFQPALDVGDKESGRPDNVIGSYAVYSKKAHNKYKTGKFCHLYRWEVTDAKGKKKWCDPLEIKDGKLIIGLPVEFMKDATYPVMAMGAGDTFGYESCGASTIGGETSPPRLIWGQMAQPAEGGSITNFFGCLKNSNSSSLEAVLALYEFSAGGDLYDYTSTVYDSAWDSTPAFNATGKSAQVGYSISASTTYYAGVFLEGGDSDGSAIMYDSHVGWTVYWENDRPTFESPPTDPLPSADSSRSDREISVYCEYSTGQAYTLTCDGTSFTETGTAASLKYGRKIAAGSGAFTETGTSASLEKTSKLVAATDSYSVSGTASDLELGRKVSAGTGSYAVSGAVATFDRTYVLSAEAGSCSVSGTAASLEVGYKVSAEVDIYTVTGSAITLSKGFTLSAGSGSFTETGTAVTLKKTSVLVADSGSYAVTGMAAGLQKGYTFGVDADSYSFSGQTVDLLKDSILELAAGSYIITGQDASLIYTAGYILVCGSGSFNMAGQIASLIKTSILVTESGGYAVTGQDAALTYAPPATILYTLEGKRFQEMVGGRLRGLN